MEERIERHFVAWKMLFRVFRKVQMPADIRVVSAKNPTFILDKRKCTFARIPVVKYVDESRSDKDNADLTTTSSNNCTSYRSDNFDCMARMLDGACKGNCV